MEVKSKMKSKLLSCPAVRAHPAAGGELRMMLPFDEKITDCMMG